MNEDIDWLYNAGLRTLGLEIRRFSFFREVKVWIMNLRRKRACEVIWSYDKGDVVYVSRRVYKLIQLYR